MNLIYVDQEKCIACGRCVKVCPNILEMGEIGPKEKYPERCIACGQCVAICPQAALSNRLAPLSKQLPIDQNITLDDKTTTQFLRSRRSIRHYKQEPVPREQLIKLVNIARFAPTAGNGQNVSYTIVENAAVLSKASQLTIDWINLQPGGNTAVHRSFAKQLQLYREGTDTILRSAPYLILATTPKEMPRGRENTVFSLAYLELYAPSLGLGSCWAGLLEMCLFDNYQPLLELFNIPEGKKITGAVMVGYPLYHYPRMVDRDPLQISWL